MRGGWQLEEFRINNLNMNTTRISVSPPPIPCALHLKAKLYKHHFSIIITNGKCIKTEINFIYQASFFIPFIGTGSPHLDMSAVIITATAPVLIVNHSLFCIHFLSVTEHHYSRPWPYITLQKHPTTFRGAYAMPFSTSWTHLLPFNHIHMRTHIFVSPSFSLLCQLEVKRLYIYR